jgi:hypothetical protein
VHVGENAAGTPNNILFLFANNSDVTTACGPLFVAMYNDWVGRVWPISMVMENPF